MPFRIVFWRKLSFAFVCALTVVYNNRQLFVLAAADSIGTQTTLPFGDLVVGIVRLDGWGDVRTTGTGSTHYVPIRGDVDDQRSFNGDFRLVATIAKECTWGSLKNEAFWQDESNLDAIRDSVAESFCTLMESGVDVIIANCGLFMWLHAKGIVTPAMDLALKKMGNRAKPRPIIALSTLITLPSFLAMYGLGADQQKAIEESDNDSSKAVIAIFTSDEQACIGILKATSQLEGTNIFTHSDSEERKSKGGILVVGLNADDVVGTGKVNGFDIVTNGTPAFYDVLNPSIQKVARAVKTLYPHAVMGIVECTEVGAYTDTIREELKVPVLDPIIMASNLMKSFVNHDYKQLNNNDRHQYIGDALSYPISPIDTLYRDVATIMYYAAQAIEKTHKVLRPLRKRLARLADGTIQGDAAKKALIAGARQIKKLSTHKSKESENSEGKIHKLRGFGVMEHLIENTDIETLVKIIRKVADQKTPQLDEEVMQSIIKVLN